MITRPKQLSDPVVTFVTSAGSIDVQLDPTKAPISVANFLRYTDAGFYDGVVFHRLFKPTGSNPAVVAQAGLLAAQADGSFTAKSPLFGPIALESQNGLSNILGSIGMARTNVPDSAAAQFYFNTANNAADFDFRSAEQPGFAVFGQTVRGLDVLAGLSQADTRAVNAGTLGVLQDFPVQPVLIQTARSTQFFANKRKDYSISASGDTLLVQPLKGKDKTPVSVASIDRLQFRDTSLGINEQLRGELSTSAVMGVAQRDNLRIIAADTADELFTAGRNNIILDGGMGRDTLTGGVGVDQFAFTTALDTKNNVDTVVGFDSAQDRILLGLNIFNVYTDAGALPAADLVVGSKPVARAANHHLLYNTRKGELAYDPDGNGKQKPVVFAKLVGTPTLDAGNLVLFDPAAI